MIKKLEDFYKKYRDHYSDDFRLRIHRSLSWIKQAYNTEEQDVKFILLWLSFNEPTLTNLLKYWEVKTHP